MRLNRLLMAGTCLLAGLSLTPLASPGHAATTQTADQPGTMTASAPLPAALSLPDAGRALRITYLSTNGITGKGLVPVTEEVILPAGKAPPGGWPIVAWAHGTSGVADHCAPSCNPWSERNRKYMSAWMKRGFAVVGTDYQGLGTPGIHAYLNTRVEAYSVLDGVRAALSSVPGLQNKIMIVGQSQGGGAAFASASYAPDYAPELNIRGTVATGAPYVSQELLQQMTSSGAQETGFNPVIVYTLYLAQGLSGYDSSFKPETVFTDKAMPAYQAAADLCVHPLTDKARTEGLNFSNALKPGYQQALAPALTAMAYPTMKLKQPLFVGTGEVDQDVPPPLQLGLVKAACAAGTVVQAHIYKGLNHDQTVNASLPDSEAFTKAVMSDQPLTPQCTPIPE
ncbi:lipase family protein [Acetobacter cerevisiae]|uniref:Lipase family protein n=1 Tax=Acetobacter cerevisiae TaxID=178900 RepID=A0A149USA8_9PROT|nr:alpha/beta hydrolase [Acetobacter cerevisiae]KXV70870.1 signal peptide-containing protein [Acetobacter cerevisiae]MCP1246121.1 lipase family protein [Acetobacter cerevisiae]MCP1255595.1 lipase family protein [Acetobacter cerevisiae]